MEISIGSGRGVICKMLNDTDFKQLMLRLGKLSPTQLGEVRRKVVSLLQLQLEVKNVKVKWEGYDRYLYGIEEAIEGRGISVAGYIFTKGFTIYSSSFPQFKEALSEVIKRSSLTQSQGEISMGYLIGTALMKWTAKRFPLRPLTVGLILSQAPHIWEAIELCFPGYRQANMLHLALTPGQASGDNWRES